MSGAYPDAVETARRYYNSEDADNFYFHIWGGEDIHIGIYHSDDEPIARASRRTVEEIAKLLPPMSSATRVLDLGAGYGGAARYLAKTFGCRVAALNLSETENDRHREMNRGAGLDRLIEVVDGSFEDIPFEDATFDVAWSQDAILHSSRREKVVAEAARVLRPGGRFLFTDPMQADDCPAGLLQPVLDRIHLESLGSPAFYRQAGQRCGLRLCRFVDHSGQLPHHYRRVHRELVRQRPALRGKVSDAYVERMLQGLQHWVNAGLSGYLVWGILEFEKTG